MAKKAKFEEAFVKSTGETVDALLLIQMNEDIIPRSIDLDNDIYCPECQHTHLTVVNRKDGQYLRKSSRGGNPRHADDCNYGVDVAGKRESREYFNKKTPIEVGHDLEQLLTKDLAIREHNPNAPKVVKKVNSRLVLTPENSNNHEKKRVQLK